MKRDLTMMNSWIHPLPRKVPTLLRLRRFPNRKMAGIPILFSGPFSHWGSRPSGRLSTTWCCKNFLRAVMVWPSLGSKFGAPMAGIPTCFVVKRSLGIFWNMRILDFLLLLVAWTFSPPPFTCRGWPILVADDILSLVVSETTQWGIWPMFGLLYKGVRLWGWPCMISYLSCLIPSRLIQPGRNFPETKTHNTYIHRYIDT